MDRLAHTITKALDGSRDELIAAFQVLLPEWIRELDFAPLRFWLSQLERTARAELPITLYGVAEAKRSLEIADLSEDEFLGNTLWGVCEDVFCYSNDDEFCDMEGTYHYYFFIPEGLVYKEGDFGACDLKATISNFDEEVRIATVSELGVPAEELLL